MPTRTFWLDLFTGETWDEFLAAGAAVSGFREKRWSAVSKIRPGDYLLCYLTGLSRFLAVLEVTSEPYRDETPLWTREPFPCRLAVRIVVALTPETGVPVADLRDELSVLQNLTTPRAWTGHFRGSPTRWTTSDGEAVLNALLEAQKQPTVLPTDKRKLHRQPKPVKAAIGHVTIPPKESAIASEEVSPKAVSEHAEIQTLLLRLGADMRFDVWVARNDRGRQANASGPNGIPRQRNELPRQFDDATNRTIELIDVLWLSGNAIVAAFEIESTSSIYSGLLRMSDLVAMQPNLKIPLYLVAPEDRRTKVLTEVNRPTFSRLRPALADICRYISFETLRAQLIAVAGIVQYLKPEFLERLSESCQIDHAA